MHLQKRGTHLKKEKRHPPRRRRGAKDSQKDGLPRREPPRTPRPESTKALATNCTLQCFSTDTDANAERTMPLALAPGPFARSMSQCIMVTAPSCLIATCSTARSTASAPTRPQKPKIRVATTAKKKGGNHLKKGKRQPPQKGSEATTSKTREATTPNKKRGNHLTKDERQPPHKKRGQPPLIRREATPSR